MLIDNSQFRSSASQDPNAGTVAENGKEIYTPQEAGDNLSRTDLEWNYDNYGELEDGVLNFGFWDLEALLDSYYTINGDWPDEPGSTAFYEAYYYDLFVPFNAQQMAEAREGIALWDDLIDIDIVETAVTDADITFGNTDDGPFSGAYAYLPYGEYLDDLYEFLYPTLEWNEPGRLSGDVWVNTQETSNFENFDSGYYAHFVIIHELGHALGLSHAGEYNATNPDGTANPADYAGDAYFYQDSNQYTIMSYFGAEETGGMWIDFRTLTYGYAGTPMVHDIVAIQDMYGADMTTRTGNTVYGFNSNADRAAYRIDDADQFLPIFTIWDAGGNDTLDLSGYDTPSVIDLNPGAYSSAGGNDQMNYTLDEINAARAAVGNDNVATQATLDFYTEYAAQYGITSGLYKDNIAIAYGADVENAIGGGGNDIITGNMLANTIKGNGGDDQISAGAGNDHVWGGNGTDVVTLGAGADRFHVDVNTNKVSSKLGLVSVDVVKDFDGTTDKIDFSGLDANSVASGDQQFRWIGDKANKNAGELSYKTYDSISGAENALGFDIDGIAGVGSHSGKVTVVMANYDGGAVDQFIVLLGAPQLTQTDFGL